MPSIFTMHLDTASMVSFAGLMSTFGALFPPLGITLAVTLVSVIYFNKLKVGWFLCNAVNQHRMDAVDAVEAECQRSVRWRYCGGPLGC